MAQLVEHILGKDEVPSSNLGISLKRRRFVYLRSQNAIFNSLHNYRFSNNALLDKNVSSVDTCPYTALVSEIISNTKTRFLFDKSGFLADNRVTALTHYCSTPENLYPSFSTAFLTDFIFTSPFFSITAVPFS